MIAPRFLPAVCLLLALGLVPTLARSMSARTLPPRSTAALAPKVLDGVAAERTDRNATWGKRRFASDDWTEQRYGATGDGARLTIVRSYDLKSLYHHPELAVAYPSPFAPAVTEHLTERPDIPVHVLRPVGESATLGMYVLEYGGRYIDDALWFQLRVAGELLLSPPQPMTLFFVTDPNSGTGDVQHSRAARLLMASVAAR
jgi:hypothetical protein